MEELLTVVEFAEACLLDCFASEDGLDVETARRIAFMCSEVLVKHGRQSVVVESGQQPET